MATVAIGPSVLRGQGAAGIVRVAQMYLSCLPLGSFAVEDEDEFARKLNVATKELRQAFPEKARSWGGPRKCLNLFLRDALYNAYLSQHYGLEMSAPWFEIPLDSVVAQALRRDAGRGKLPPWMGVKRLNPVTSRAYQNHAQKLAEAHGTFRVHLDAILWTQGR